MRSYERYVTAVLRPFGSPEHILLTAGLPDFGFWSGVGWRSRTLGVASAIFSALRIALFLATPFRCSSHLHACASFRTHSPSNRRKDGAEATSN